MTPEALIALFALALGTVWTPGPNNALLASSGARYGFRATIPHALGVAIGFPVMVFATALGLGEVFRAVPLIGEVLRWIGAALLIWLAWKVFNAPAPGTQKGKGRPWRFIEAAAFQWINPKAWIMAISVISVFVTGTAPLLEAALCAGAYLLAGLSSAHGWAGFGAALQRFLSTPIRLRAFNGVMAALILMTVYGLMFADLTA
ncbi:threonine/homoserine/homoserine lactone efflux protein [Rubricella aquisinus]|uniref:Threonine/homoserine/homoserine lactone efflux protein n=1 Tax=Rubricella aquisinus TaxID=2028108 RepID=A0A840WJ04_9RHOB|nr:threonine/homoserine/homoserine lactone efflux protein [Rubricella aquisinus]